MLFIVACAKNLRSLNNDPKNPTNVPAYSLFTNAQRSLARTVSSANVNLNIFRLITQQWQETFVQESRYDLNNRNIPQNLWTAFYREALRNFDEAKKLIPSQVTYNAAQRDNEVAIIDIMEVYVWFYLVTTYGNIPYTESLDINNVFPAYDDAATIYNDLLTRLDHDIAALNTSAPGFGSADVIYGDDITAWRKFGNSFKLKMGMTIADVDPAKAKSTVETAAVSGIFTSNADNAQFKFLASSPPNTNPVWEALVQSGRKDFVAASTIVDLMESLNDPRIDNYFTVDAAGGYSGGSPGRFSNYSTFSKPATAITAPDFPGLLLDYSEVEFLLAEAIERGFNVAGTASTHYDNAITASILYWEGTAADAATYLAQPSINYVTAPGNYKQNIGIQKWIALYNRGLDAWIEWRRLDYPQLQAAYLAVSDIPVRFTYPVNEQNYNTENYNAAASDIGGDDVTTRLWWDKF